MPRLLLVALALLSTGCWAGSKPLPDVELLKACKEACVDPSFCAYADYRWSCVTPAAK